ncbi:hypothetical protein [Salininema proteolyticum]|uniref:ABC-2 type transport system permease protein n=1 Tax=Salininema proteolyticum TaxID=1607685 RepID=A0ABV8U384_9ACTN
MRLRLGRSMHLAALLLLFFRRRVLRVGLFRARTARVAAGLLGLVLFGVLCSAAYLFLEPLSLSTGEWDLLFDISTTSLVLWVMGAFLVVKVLFINAEGMLELSYQLPVTNRERAVALLLYEAAITGAVAAVGFAALSVTSLVILGVGAVPYILTTLVFPAAIVYLTLSVLYQVSVRLLGTVGLGSVANLLTVLLLFIGLAYYSSTIEDTVFGITDAYLDGAGAFHWQNTIHRLWDASPVLALAASLVAMAVLAAAAMALTPAHYVRQSRFLKLFSGPQARLVLHPYDYCLIRNTQTTVSAIVATVLFVYFLLGGSINPMWSLPVLAMAGLYHYSGTDVIRSLPTCTDSPVVTYARLLKGQLVLLTAFAIPQAGIAALVDPFALDGTGTVLLSAFAGVVITTWVSVVFPSEKNNPFSIFLGVACAAAMFGLIAVGLGMLKLPAPVTWGVLAFCAALVVAHTIVEIHTNESRRRNEQDQDRRHIPDGLVDGHGRHHRRGPAGAHVLDRS